jgi:hypothetical protein
MTSESGANTNGIRFFCFLLISSVNNFEKYPDRTAFKGLLFYLMNIIRRSRSMYLSYSGSMSSASGSFIV